ncbi:sel1 repeat family protein [uncultured Ruminobacter sp.]|uniref:sel1 repeat family protein n=1 Tax=uncultured Ruminobacter sp. TaxID=538947 RepID=UPI00260C24A7|nr:sel1 repeat family protein [uncultured Ruminobacter sp.]
MGFSYGKVQSVRQNFQQAIYYYQKACDLKDEMGCANVGVKYYNGQGVKQNINTEKWYHGKT